MRLRVSRGDSDSIAGVTFGFGQHTDIEQQQRERLGRREIVGIQPHDPRKQRLHGLRSILRSAQLIEQRERAHVLWRAFKKLDDPLLGLAFVVGREERAYTAKVQGPQRLRPTHRPVKFTAARLT